MPNSVRSMKAHSNTTMITRAGEYDQALGQNGGTTNVDRVAAEERRQAVKALVEHNFRCPAQKNRGADRNDDKCHRVCFARGRDSETVKGKADGSGNENRNDCGEWQWHTGVTEKDGGHSPQHDELALGEVHHIRRIIDQREADRDEAIDRAHSEPGKDELQELRHRSRHPSPRSNDTKRTDEVSRPKGRLTGRPTSPNREPASSRHS